MAQQHYDLLVIGAGAAGNTAATTAAENGARVALVERDKIGGTCLNYGCDPTKTLLHIASLLQRSRQVQKYGLHGSALSLDWKSVLAYMQSTVNDIRGGTSGEAREQITNDKLNVLQGEARFVSSHEVVVCKTGSKNQPGTEYSIIADRIIIATGCQTVVPQVPGIDEAGYITNVQAVALPDLPRRMAIVGGGAIGIEFAQMFQRFGVAVTVLENSPTILAKEDLELAAQLCDILTKEGIRLETEVKLIGVQRTAHGKRLAIRCGEKEQEELEVDELLLAAGRRPVLEGLNLEAAGVTTTKRGIAVDEMLRTNVPHIWAAGDITGGLQFTHLAYEQGKVAAHNAFAQHPQPFGDRVIPWVTFTDPALAHVGKTEEELREDGVLYSVGRMQFKDVERAVTEGDTAGLVKLLVDGQGKILGGHILGNRADDLLAPIVLAIRADLPVSTLASTILPYPTRSEGVRWAADRVGD